MVRPPASQGAPAPSTVAGTAHVETKPAGGRGSDVSMMDRACWERLVASAAGQPRDAALLSSLTFRAGDSTSVTLVARDDEASAGYLRGNVEMVRALVTRLAGRPIDVRLEFEGNAAPRSSPQQRLTIGPEIRDHPVVKLAADLFDAVVVDVTPLRREEAVPDLVAGTGPAVARSTDSPTDADSDV